MTFRKLGILTSVALALATNGCLCWLTGDCDETLLTTPVLPSPETGSVDQPTALTLSWRGGDSPSGKAVNYDVYFGLTTPPPLLALGVSEKSVSVDSLVEAKTYHWQVVANEDGGARTVSSIWTFTTVFPPKFLTVDYPTWATSWARGESRNILWRSAYAGAQVKIDLLKGSSPRCPITPATLNDGSFTWQLTDCVVYSDPDYSVRVTSLLDTTLYDDTDFFTVVLSCPIEVNSPHLREIWVANEAREIQWRPLGYGTNIKVALYLYKAHQFVYVIAGVTPDDGSFTWTVSDFGAGSGPDYRVRISDLNEFDCSVFGQYFSIQACSVSVTSPTLDEFWPLGSEQVILWDPSYISEEVTLELYHDGDFVCILDQNVANAGIYLWTATRCESVYGENFQIKVVSEGDGSCGFSARFRFRP